MFCQVVESIPSTLPLLTSFPVPLLLSKRRDEVVGVSHSGYDSVPKEINGTPFVPQILYGGPCPKGTSVFHWSRRESVTFCYGGHTLRSLSFD